MLTSFNGDNVDCDEDCTSQCESPCMNERHQDSKFLREIVANALRDNDDDEQ